MMTQEEINRMMQGGIVDDTPAEPSDSDLDNILTDDEKDALGEIGNISMGTSATTLYTLLNHRVSITTPKVSIGNLVQHLAEYNKPFVAVEVSYVEGINGYNVFILKQEDVVMITDLLMGGDGKVEPDAPLDELALSAISEVMNQMVGSSSTALADMLGRTVNISTPTVKPVDTDSTDFSDLMGQDDVTIKISFTMEIEDLLVSEIMQIIPVESGRELLDRLLYGNMDDEPTPQPAAPPVAPPVQTPQEVPQSMIDAAQSAQATATGHVTKEPNVTAVKAVEYQSFDTAPSRGSMMQHDSENIDLLMEVPLQVTVELGQCKKNIKEILGFSIGSVVVLDRLAGEMVDVKVNGKLFAVGEVVVIDDNYGVRLTDIVKPKD